MKNVRLEDIAKRLNITKVSVSKALRNHKDISAETRKKVKVMAAEMGYHPNLQARSLTSKKSQTIGVIVPKIAHTFFASAIEGIYKTAEENGYKVILGVSYENEKLEKENIDSMVNMRVDGLVVSVTEQTKNADAFKIVRDMGINLVFFDRGFKDVDCSYIKVADYESAKEGVKYLIGKGFKNIGHLAGYNSSQIGKERKRGFIDALKEADYQTENAPIVEGGFSEIDGFHGFGKILKEYGMPDAIFAVTYPVGLGILNYMADHGISPAKLPVMTFGGSDFNQYLASPFICIDQPNFELGKLAFQRLLSEMESGKEIEPEVIELQATINAAVNR